MLWCLNSFSNTDRLCVSIRISVVLNVNQPPADSAARSLSLWLVRLNSAPNLPLILYAEIAHTLFKARTLWRNTSLNKPFFSEKVMRSSPQTVKLCSDVQERAQKSLWIILWEPQTFLKEKIPAKRFGIATTGGRLPPLGQLRPQSFFQEEFFLPLTGCEWFSGVRRRLEEKSRGGLLRLSSVEISFALAGRPFVKLQRRDFNMRLLLKRDFWFWLKKQDYTLTMMTVSGRILSVIFLETYSNSLGLWVVTLTIPKDYIAAIAPIFPRPKPLVRMNHLPI